MFAHVPVNADHEIAIQRLLKFLKPKVFCGGGEKMYGMIVVVSSKTLYLTLRRQRF